MIHRLSDPLGETIQKRAGKARHSRSRSAKSKGDDLAFARDAGPWLRVRRAVRLPVHGRPAFMRGDDSWRRASGLSSRKQPGITGSGRKQIKAVVAYGAHRRVADRGRPRGMSPRPERGDREAGGCSATSEDADALDPTWPMEANREKAASRRRYSTVLLPTLAESTAEEGEGGTRLNGSPPQPRTAIRGPGVAERVRRLEAVIGSRGRESRRDGKVWPRRYISPRLPRPAICTVTGRGRQDSIMRLRTVWSMDSAAFGFCCRLCSTRWRSL